MINLQLQILRKVVNKEEEHGKTTTPNKFFKQGLHRNLNLADITPVYKKNKKFFKLSVTYP